MKLRKVLASLLVIGISATAWAAAGKLDFSGTWVFNPAKSKNVGMMASMQLTSTIKQTATAVVVSDIATLNGDEHARETHYDLNGKPVANLLPMGEKGETVTRWANGKLVTTWTNEGAVAGTKIVRTETRSLSSDGKVMTVETVRGDSAPVIMVFERQ
jgi:hypothetical protein